MCCDRITSESVLVHGVVRYSMKFKLKFDILPGGFTVLHQEVDDVLCDNDFYKTHHCLSCYDSRAVKFTNQVINQQWCRVCLGCINKGLNIF